MKTMLKLLLMSLFLFTTACMPEDDEVTPSAESVGNVVMSAGGHTFTVTMEQNTTAEAFRAMLPLELEMSELHGNEKYHYLDRSLPTNTVHPGIIHAGDIMLYGNNCVVVFYETFSTSYSYSVIGHITDTDHLSEALGSGSVTINFQKQ